MYIQASVPGSDAPEATASRCYLHGFSHLCTVPASTSPADMHIPSRCLSATPEQSGPGTGMSLRPSGLTFPRRCCIPTPPQCAMFNLFRSNENRSLRFCLLYQGRSIIQTNKGCRASGGQEQPRRVRRQEPCAHAWGARRLPSASWTLPCFAYVSVSAAFRAELLYYTALDCYIFNQK